MDAEKSADKLRRAAERDHGPDKTKANERRKADTKSAEANAELTQPELSKGRPPADEGSKGQRPSNAGRDGS